MSLLRIDIVTVHSALRSVSLQINIEELQGCDIFEFSRFYKIIDGVEYVMFIFFWELFDVFESL